MADEVVGRGIELAAVGRLLAGASRTLAALVVEGEAGIGKSTIWEAGVAAATDAGFTVLSCRPARSEQRLTLGALTDLLAHIDAEVFGQPAGSAAARARDRPPPRCAVGDASGPAHPVGGPRRPAPTPDRWRARPAGRRRRAMARRELRGHPRLCHQAAGGGTARGAGLGPDRVRRCPGVSVARGPGAGSDGARPRGGDAARVAPSPVPAAAGPVVPAARARPDRSGVPWQPALRPGDRAGAPGGRHPAGPARTASDPRLVVRPDGHARLGIAGQDAAHPAAGGGRG